MGKHAAPAEIPVEVKNVQLSSWGSSFMGRNNPYTPRSRSSRETIQMTTKKVTYKVDEKQFFGGTYREAENRKTLFSWLSASKRKCFQRRRQPTTTEIVHCSAQSASMPGGWRGRRAGAERCAPSQQMIVYVDVFQGMASQWISKRCCCSQIGSLQNAWEMS